MTKTPSAIRNAIHGFPRIGEQRELKKALEAYWSGKADFATVEAQAKTLRERHWRYQAEAGIDLVAVNDFSLYDTTLDACVMLNAIPPRFRAIAEATERYFAMARGNAANHAMEMTKWFNTNYHLIVPELAADDDYRLNAAKIRAEYAEAKASGHSPKIQVIGPITFLKVAKTADGSDTLAYLDRILPVYEALVQEVAGYDDLVYLQFDEPAFVRDPDAAMLAALKRVYDKLASVSDKVKLIVATYFEQSSEATKVLAKTPIWGLAVDLVHGPANRHSLGDLGDKVLLAGVVDGRNIWVNNIAETVRTLKELSANLPQTQIVVTSSCSLLHVPFTLDYETELPTDVKSWLSYAKEKLAEIALITKLFHGETDATTDAALKRNEAAIASRRSSPKIHNQAVLKRAAAIGPVNRSQAFAARSAAQKAALSLPDLPTTTIGSFPQTPELRKLRKDWHDGAIDEAAYEAGIKRYIDEAIAFQEACGLDVLVHGEPERNDMVEYFGERLSGFAFSHNGWVQSYGSRCVKPPIIFGDVSRPQPMTVDTIRYAQSKTTKIMKGMLTGPVTILNWSFVRDDLPRSAVCDQIALALSDEVADLQAAGIKIIQVDEAAFKEGYPLRAANIPGYEAWAVRGFKLSVCPARPETQIHTHMCYSEFNDIMPTIEALDADVISIESARSDNSLLETFKRVGYAQDIGPGIYDIHSPRVPDVAEMVDQIRTILKTVPVSKLWINPDCGLKTRRWEEVRPSLENMVKASQLVKQELGR